MKKTVYAGAVALALAGLLPTMPGANASEFNSTSAEQSRPTTPINVGRIRNVLHLT